MAAPTRPYTEQTEHDSDVLKHSKYALYVVGAVAAGVSYWTQKGLLLDAHGDQVSAWAIPITVDVAVIVCSIVINSRHVDPEAKRRAWIVMVGAALVSVVANFYAGENPVLKIAHVWCVVIYLGTEWVASRAKTRKPEPEAAETPAPPAKRTPAKKATPAKAATPATSARRGRPKPVKVTTIEEIEAAKQQAKEPDAEDEVPGDGPHPSQAVPEVELERELVAA